MMEKKTQAGIGCGPQKRNKKIKKRNKLCEYNDGKQNTPITFNKCGRQDSTLSFSLVIIFYYFNILANTSLSFFLFTKKENHFLKRKVAKTISQFPNNTIKLDN
ncbi:uncharacterized protein DS421_14g478900 [Arachis hypogaea]|nr:uncharacterized protein DS421_14g478900 [Arachis hypogaea]